jgi:Peptidase C13 family
MHSLIRETLSLLAVSFRALFLLRLPDPLPAPSFPALCLTLSLATAALAGFEAASADEPPSFNPDGLAAAIATWVVAAVFIQCLWRQLRPFSLATVVGSLAGVSVWFFSIISLISLAATRFGWTADQAIESYGVTATAALVGAAVLWLFAAEWRIARAVTRGMPRRLGLMLPVVALLPIFFVPQKSILGDPNAPVIPPTVWTIAEFWRGQQPTAEAEPSGPRLDIEAAWDRQSDLVANALAQIAPSRSGIAEVYFVGMAAFAEQDVFKREVVSAKAIMDARFDTQERSTLLINHRDTVSTQPLANATNLAKILAGIGRAMDPDKDLLVLYVTSHGTNGRIAVSFPDFGLNALTPERLAAILDQSGIKNRVVILSACHAGSFVPALAHPGTLVLTAAHADKTSFGCSNEREWTYFGDALFNHALRKTTSFVEAFHDASRIVGTWEAAQKLTPSEPQISLGSTIGATLDAVHDRLSASSTQAPETPPTSKP